MRRPISKSRTNYLMSIDIISLFWGLGKFAFFALRV
jgi:hypothetical protein